MTSGEDIAVSMEGSQSLEKDCFPMLCQENRLVVVVNVLTEHQNTDILFFGNLSYLSNCKTTMESSSRECNCNVSNNSTVK